MSRWTAHMLVGVLVILVGGVARAGPAATLAPWPPAPAMAPQARPRPHLTSLAPPPPHLGDRPQAEFHPIPRTGDQKLLILLADFPDRPGLFTGQAWRSVFFGPGGFADYYREVSYNQLRYSGDVVGLHNGSPVTNSAAADYIRLSHPITYYANGQYGYKVGAFPQNDGGVVYHAVQALDAAGFNFAPYADPTTHVVDNLIVIFGGSSYSYTGDPDHSLNATGSALDALGAPGGQYVTAGGQIVDNFTLCPDQRFNLSGLIAYIDICAHEQGHGLGMGDMYDFSYTTSGAGKFDVMAYGLYGASDGSRPFQFGAFSKTFFGWLTPTVAAVGTYSYHLGPAETGPRALTLYPHGLGTSREYFLLENRQPVGFDQDWTTGGLCAGLLIWHIDDDIVNNYLYNMNTLASAGGPPHQGAIVVEADGRFDMIHPPINYGECGDTWAVGQTWNASSTPNSNLWDGSASQLAVTVTRTCPDGSLVIEVTVGGTAPSEPFHLFLPLVQGGSGC